MNLRQAAQVLHGEVCGGRILAPGPGHSKADRSLSVWLDGGVVRVHSYSGDSWQECQQYARQRLGLGQWEGRSTGSQKEPVKRPVPAPAVPAENRRNEDLARRIWRETVDIRGTIGETYLARERGLPGVIDEALALTVRFHGSCPFRDGDVTVRSPALIAALRDPYVIMSQCQKLGELWEVERWILRKPELVKAIQRIRLDKEGRKVERKTLGSMGDGVVFIGSIWQCFYGAHATIAEGVETALAMRSLGFEGCVALAGAGRFRTIQLPFHWANVTIGAENDAASENAWNDAGSRFASEGRDVTIWRPPARFKDANDLIMAKGAAA